MASGERSLRTRFILVAMCAVVPLAALGLVLVERGNHAGEALLVSQLDDQLTRAADLVGARWQEQLSDLLLLGENEPARLALSMPRAASMPDTAPAFVRRAFAAMTALEDVTVRDRSGTVRWRLGAAGGRGAGFGSASTQPASGPAVVVRVPLTDLVNRSSLGSLEARVNAAALLPGIALTDSRTGPMLAVALPGGPLIAPPGSDQAIFRADRVTSGGQPWLSKRRAIAEPPLELVAAAALDPYVAPFRRAAREGAAALVLAAALLIAVIIAAARRLTGGLEELVTAAEAVTAGNLDRRVEVHGHDEVGRLGAAFNTMTDSLRSTMKALAQREALAAVGEFAAELAHEIRNPLTSLRLDLQRLDEVGHDRATARGILARALRQVARLDRAVTGSLRVSRGANAERGPVALHEVVEAAVRDAEAEFTHRGARLAIEPAREPLMVHGDAAALEQLFVNLLVNAAQALGSGGTTTVSVSPLGRSACVSVADDGPGMTADQVEKARSPFFSTKRDGTGLGLTIARRIAAEHGGSLELQSAIGLGTRVLVHLPVASNG